MAEPEFKKKIRQNRIKKLEAEVRAAMREVFAQELAEQKEMMQNLPPAKEQPCPSCKAVNYLADGETCFECFFRSLPPPGEWKPGNWYNRAGDIFHVIWEPDMSVSIWHPSGIDTTHAADDRERVTGLNIWGASTFCLRLLHLILNPGAEKDPTEDDEPQKESEASTETVSVL